MSVETDADRLGVLSDFGLPVSWTPAAGGAAAALSALFDNATHTQARFAEDPAAIVTEATLTVRASDLPVGAAVGDAVTAEGTAYRVRTILPDGTGLAAVHLERDFAG